MKRSRWARIGAALLLLVAANTAAEWEISHRLEQRYRGVLGDDEGLLGDFRRISVCLPCLSYTLHELRLESRDAPPDRPILYARAVDVGGDLPSLLRGRLRGRIVLRDAQLRMEVGGAHAGATAFSVPWSELGRGLFPAPIARIEAVEDSRAVLRHDGFDEPIEWGFRIAKGRAVRLAPADGPPRVFLEGSTPGRGHFELTLRVAEPGGERSRLRGALRDVSLEHLDSYLRQRVGVEVESGEVSAHIALEEADEGWQGTVDCEVVDLQVFELRDLVEQSPLQATRDGVAGVVGAMRRSPDGVLRVRMDVHGRADATAGDRWRAAAEILRWLVLAPFELPLRLLEAASP